MTTKTIRQLLAIFVLGLMSTVAQAQGGPGDPGDPGVDPDPNPPRTDIPFDGGLSLVAAAGIAYAAKKGYDKRKAKN